MGFHQQKINIRGKGTIIMIRIGLITLKPRVVLQYILKNFMPPLKPPQYICINIALIVASLFYLNFIPVHAFVNIISYSLEIIGIFLST